MDGVAGGVTTGGVLEGVLADGAGFCEGALAAGLLIFVLVHAATARRMKIQHTSREQITDQALFQLSCFTAPPLSLANYTYDPYLLYTLNR